MFFGWWASECAPKAQHSAHSQKKGHWKVAKPIVAQVHVYQSLATIGFVVPGMQCLELGSMPQSFFRT